MASGVCNPRKLEGRVHLAVWENKREGGPWVWPATSDRCHRKGQQYDALQRIRKQAGLREFSWHVLRHTFASQLVMAGAPLKVVQELLGHSTMTMTLRYAHLSPGFRKSAVNLLVESYGTLAAHEVEEPDASEDGSG